MSPPEFYMQVPGKLRPSRWISQCASIAFGAMASPPSLAYNPSGKILILRRRTRTRYEHE
jgi:hypothetical protein